MSVPDDYSSSIEESDADRRRGILAEGALSLDLVSAYAGDRKLKQVEVVLLADLRESRGQRYFSDLLYALTHQYFAPDVAEELWNSIVQHKHALEKRLGRDVKIVVATLDYLSNITENMGAATLISETHIEEIVGLSLRDGMTGLFNHSYFYQQIELEVKRYVRYGADVSVLLIDIDDFKQVNDRFGHREGDRILSAMGKELMRLARDSDVCCRYGGEEFAVILPLTGIREAELLAERMRIELAQTLPDGKVVTVSIGVADCGKNTRNLQDLVERADSALYQIKRSGKNQVMVVGDRDSNVKSRR